MKDMLTNLKERKKRIEDEFNANNQQIAALGEQRAELNRKLQNFQIRQEQLKGENKQVQELMDEATSPSKETPPDEKKKENTEGETKEKK